MVSEVRQIRNDFNAHSTIILFQKKGSEGEVILLDFSKIDIDNNCPRRHLCQAVETAELCGGGTVFDYHVDDSEHLRGAPRGRGPLREERVRQAPEAGGGGRVRAQEGALLA